jgi:uncharacterized membrane protein
MMLILITVNDDIYDVGDNVTAFITITIIIIIIIIHQFIYKGMPAEHAKRQVIISQRPNKSNQSGKFIRRHVCYRYSV